MVMMWFWCPNIILIKMHKYILDIRIQKVINISFCCFLVLKLNKEAGTDLVLQHVSPVLWDSEKTKTQKNLHIGLHSDMMCMSKTGGPLPRNRDMFVWLPSLLEDIWKNISVIMFYKKKKQQILCYNNISHFFHRKLKRTNSTTSSCQS